MSYTIQRALGFAAALALAACGSSDDGDAATNLSSPDTVAKQVATIVSATVSVAGVESSGNAGKTLQDGQCDSGSESQFDESQVDVGSPYTSQAFDLFGTRFQDCRLNDENSNDFFVFDGATRSGFVSQGEDIIDYFQIGEGPSAPLSFRIHSESGGTSSDSVFNFDAVVHSRDASSGAFDGEMFLMYDGEIGASGVNADFLIRLGNADAAGSRFVVSDTASGLTLDGAYSISLDQVIDQGLNCSASATIATGVPLLESQSTTLFGSGSLTLSGGGETASVEFHSDDTVTITTSTGTETIPQSELQSRGAECAGLFAAGLGFF